jgi:AcrR family transcriptional regulator
MPRAKRSAAALEAMRERILDAAHELVRERGIQAFTIRALAERLGVSHMVLYGYFPNRSAILDALSERQYARMQANHERAYREAEEGDVTAVVRRALAAWGERARERPRLYRLILMQPIGEEHPAPRLLGRLAQEREHLERLITLGTARGVLAQRDAHLAALVATSIVNGPLMLYHSGRLADEALAARAAEEALNVAMDYLCRSGETTLPHQE